MEIKKIKIGIKTAEEGLRDFAETFQKALKGEKVAKKEGVYFESVEALRTFITPRRIELIRAIHQQKPSSAYELAKMVDRDVKSVMTDLAALKSLGLVTLNMEKENKRGKVHPLVEYDMVQVEIAV